MTAIAWADAVDMDRPVQSVTTRQIDAIVDQLRRNPGRPARVRTNVGYSSVSTNCSYFRRGCKVVTRRNPAGGWDHFAAWPITESAANPVADLEAFRSVGRRRMGLAS